MYRVKDVMTEEVASCGLADSLETAVRIMRARGCGSVPIVDANAYLGDQPLGEAMDAILVNRFYLRGVEQIDRRTGERHQKLPGAPLGGVSWQDRSR